MPDPNKRYKFSLEDIECTEARYRVAYLLEHPELDKVSHILYEAALRKYQRLFDTEKFNRKGEKHFELDESNELE